MTASSANQHPTLPHRCDPASSTSDDSASSSHDGDDAVIIGPDINPTRSALDRKIYRQIILKNGLRALLISDTIAMGQKENTGDMGGNDSGYESEASSVEKTDGDDDDSSEAMDGGSDCRPDDDIDFGDEEYDGSEGGGEGIRHAAAALSVGCGSYHDPVCAQGLAHFLEHMLFMGTKRYPEENAYDAFMSQCGGSNNAYTEAEQTVYHFEVPQDKLFDAMDMFSQFFVAPLLLEDAAGRELSNIESEFQLSKNSDESRLHQLMCHTGKGPDDHPFGKFSWGNTQSLKVIPEENRVDMMAEIRNFYDQHYFAPNMRLVVIGAFSLEDLQTQVVQYFSDVPPKPRVASPLATIRENVGMWEEVKYSPISNFGMPFQESALQKIYRIVPVKDRHTLTVTWQVPPQGKNWRSKPCDYIAHLLGHESEGSLLSSLKESSWATDCWAGVGSGGHENASSHAFFCLTLALSEEGVSHWADILSEVYTYIGMVRHHCQSREGLPAHIYEELKSIQSVAHKFKDESMPEDLVEELVEDMVDDLPPERLLDGNSLLFDFNGDAIQHLLDDFLTPQNARVDLMSSTFRKESDSPNSCANTDDIMDGSSDGAVKQVQDPTQLPETEPNFGTKFWCQPIPLDLIGKWHNLSSPQLPPASSSLSLPPINPYIPTKFDLKPPPLDNEEEYHPILHCSLKVCIAFGIQKSWFPATAKKFDKIQNQVLLSYEKNEKWHRLDEASSTKFVKGSKGTLDDNSIHFEVTDVPSEDKEVRVVHGCNGSDRGIDDHFPPIPPPLSASRLPKVVSDIEGLKIWHYQDTTFKRPIAELRLKIVCSGANKSPFYRACADLFVSLCRDAVTETSYLADVCELGSSIGASDVGFTVRVHGFDHKLLELTGEILRLLFSFSASNSDLPPTIKKGRFEACLEVLLRRYGNAGMHASSFATDIRLMCIRPNMWSAHAKAKSLEGVTSATFKAVISDLLSNVFVEALYCGNVDLTDARDADKLIQKILQDSKCGVLPHCKQPEQLVIDVPLADVNKTVVVPTRDPKDPNTAVEVYFQINRDNLEQRVLIDLLSQIIYEPLFDQLRTKEQFGYSVSVGARWSFGVMGMSFKVVTSSKSAHEVSERLDRFLLEFREDLSSMKQETFLEHVVGLAKNKLHMFNSLEEECSSRWSEISEGRYIWEAYRDEAEYLSSVGKDQLVKAYDEWFPSKCDPKKPQVRKCFTVHVIGNGEIPASSGRPVFEAEVADEKIAEEITGFHAFAGRKTWGKIY